MLLKSLHEEQIANMDSSKNFELFPLYRPMVTPELSDSFKNQSIYIIVDLYSITTSFNLKWYLYIAFITRRKIS